MKPLGRRPGETRTRQAILDAARESFARQGYDRTTIRGIAQEAGVDPALVMHFFPTKDRLFAAVMELPFDAPAEVRALLDADRGRLGENLVRMFLRVWDDPESGPRMVGLLRSASSYDAAAEGLRELLESRILTPLATELDAPDPALRVALASSQLVGMALLRYVLRMEPVASASAERLTAALAPNVHRYLTGDLGDT